jgi:hypothetical protein
MRHAAVRDKPPGKYDGQIFNLENAYYAKNKQQNIVAHAHHHNAGMDSAIIRTSGR